MAKKANILTMDGRVEWWTDRLSYRNALHLKIDTLRDFLIYRFYLKWESLTDKKKDRQIDIFQLYWNWERTCKIEFQKYFTFFFDQSLISWNRVASSFTRTNLVFVVNLFSFTTIGQEEGPRKQFRLWSIYWIILVWLTDLIASNLISSEHLIHTCPYVLTYA